MTYYELMRLRAMVSVLHEVQTDYPGRTIENIITQIESRLKEAEKKKL